MAQEASNKQHHNLVATWLPSAQETPVAHPWLPNCFSMHALAAEKAPLNQIAVESAGVATACGEQAQLLKIQLWWPLLENVSIDLSQHKSQPLTQESIDCA
jgi:hypothetical protein